MSKFLQLAADLEREPIDSGLVKISITEIEREMVVVALRGADAFRTLAELQERSFTRQQS